MSHNTSYSLFLDSVQKYHVSVYLQQPASLLAAKEMAERLGVDSSSNCNASKAYTEEKDEQNNSA